jgi:hypothetical protein
MFARRDGPPAAATCYGAGMSDDPTPNVVPAAALPPAALAELLEASATTIAAEMRSLGDDARWHPAAGEWCANEVLGHILEAERRGFNGRIRTILAETDPLLAGWDQVAIAAARNDCDRDPEALLAEFLAIRAESVDLVRSLAPGDLVRSGEHAVVGRLSVGDVAAEWVHHDRNHVRQMLANSQARVWQQMGNAQRFSASEG